MQLEALQRQHAAPEAATPSFVAKQRQQLAAAAAAQGQLQAENVQLAAQVLELRRALDKAGGAGAANEAASANEDEDADDPLGAAERMLRGSAEAPPSAAAGSPGGSGSSAWKEAEIERLQQDNRQLVAKVRRLWLGACVSSRHQHTACDDASAHGCSDTTPRRRSRRCRSACMSWSVRTGSCSDGACQQQHHQQGRRGCS